ncbi:hypothetical protein E8E11_011176 [Didymella keratinophila]|nr:hypothetical protein E8E11_011176 [Didymella keratinophila]
MNESDGSDTNRGRFAPGAGDDDSADDDSDDEPVTLEYIARWKAKRQSRAAVAPSTASSRRQFVSSEESDGYVPLSSSDTESSDSKLPRSDSDIDLRSKSRKKDSSSKSETASDSEDSGPLVPVFSKWKAAQKARHAGSDANTVTKRQSVTSSSSEEEDITIPLWWQARSTQCRRIIVESSDDEQE